MSTMPLIVRWAEEHVYKHKIDAIVACGHSGLVIAGALSYVTRIPVFATRKQGEPTVAYPSTDVSAVAPNGPAQNWLWFDDFISSGGTFRHAAKLVWARNLVERPYPALILEYNASQATIARYPSVLKGMSADRYDISRSVPDYDWASAPDVLPTFGFKP